MRTNIILGIFLLTLFLTPISAINVTTVSFSKNTSELLPLLTADKVKVMITSFSAEKNEVKEVPIYIAGVVDLSEAIISVKYDNSVIKVENVSKGDFNISYSVEGSKVKITLDLNQSFSGDFLLGKIFFRAIGNEGESSSLKIEVDELLDNNSNELPYLTIDGMFYIKIKNEEKEEAGGKLDESLKGLFIAENKSKFAEENNLEFKDNKVRVIIKTNNTIEDKFINLSDLPSLVNNHSIKNIRAYKKSSSKGLIIAGFVAALVFVSLIIFKIRRK